MYDTCNNGLADDFTLKWLLDILENLETHVYSSHYSSHREMRPHNNVCKNIIYYKT